MPITLAVADRVATVTIDRPEKLNALDPAHLLGLRARLAEVDADPEVRVTILTGAGDRAFCVGADLTAARSAEAGVAEALGLDLEGSAERGLYVRLFNLGTLDLKKPLIAAVNGYCLGGGLELALQCDLLVAADTAAFGLPEVVVASLPGGGGVPNLLRAVPRAVAMRMLLTGERIDAARAHAIGLVSDVFPAATLAEDTQRLARQIAGNGPLAVQLVKMLAATDDLPPAQAFRMTELAWGVLRDTADRAEGRAAFAERRRPLFRGR
jgi:E-phenylitaconyl-CoA hydratase